MRPMLASTADRVPDGAGWVHEVKWDGMRLLADLADGRVRLTSRNENVVTPAWPDVATAPSGVADALFDGEVIALNQAGVPDFRVLQDRMHVRRASTVRRLVETRPVTFMVFDLLRLEGRDLTTTPLEERRRLLGEVLEGQPWQVPSAYDDGDMLMDATRQQGLEGVVSKRRDSRYRFGARTPHWLKFPHRYRASYVVGGWRPQRERAGEALAALLVGEVTDDGLLYRGRVGSGIAARASRVLTDAIAGLARVSSPFDDEVPRVDAAGTHWLEPRLVVDVETHGLHYPRLRQPSYQGLRTDLTPDDLAGGLREVQRRGR